MRAHLPGLAKAEDRQDRASAEIEGPVAENDPYPRYEPGVYEAECLRAEVYFDRAFKRWNCLLKFALVPTGEPVCGFLNLGSGQKPHAGPRSEYRRAWIIAQGEQPKRRQVLSKRVFERKIFEVEIEDVKQSHDGSEHPAKAIYSRVKRIVRRTYP